MRQKTGKVAAAIVSGCALYIFLLYLLLNCFIIFPDSSYISPQQAGIPRFQEKPFTADDGTKIMCWYAKGNPDKPAILFFHGNAGQIATFSLQMAAYLRKGYSVMMPEYRGFASTPGEFSQENIATARRLMIFYTGNSAIQTSSSSVIPWGRRLRRPWQRSGRHRGWFWRHRFIR